MEPGDAEPIWTRGDRAPLAGWPVGPRISAALHYRLPLHTLWSGPEVSAASGAVVHAYRGRSFADWATVAFIADPDPAADLGAWVAAPLAATGFPIVPPNSGPAPRLLVWEPVGRSTALVDRLGIAQARCFAGLAATEIDDAPALMRLYVLLARDEAAAWNVALAVESACPPGCGSDLVAVNDHVRAAATFGGLWLG